jgi:hypothetical protein
MDQAPTLHRYRAADREEVFGFFRDVFPLTACERAIKQWAWKYETNPFTPPAGPVIDLIRIGPRLVSIVAGFSLPMWMGGIECAGEGRGTWIVHPEYRGRNLWKQVDSLSTNSAPVQIGWSRLPPRVSRNVKFLSDPVRPLMRILDAGPVAAHFTGSHALGRLGSAMSAVARTVWAFGSVRDARRDEVVRLESFDERADALWERARRPHSAMVARGHRYLNWRFCQRPDATYFLYGFERGGELDGFLVARAVTYRGMQWGYLVDFMAPENSSEVLRSLVGAAIDEFRALGVAAVSCHATDPAARGALFRSGFFPVLQREPIRFTRLIREERPDLAKFAALKPWYLTMGDGDLEMAP